MFMYNSIVYYINLHVYIYKLTDNQILAGVNTLFSSSTTNLFLLTWLLQQV